MDYYSKPINQLVEALSMLPGIGSKTAQHAKRGCRMSGDIDFGGAEQRALLQGVFYIDRR